MHPKLYSIDLDNQRHHTEEVWGPTNKDQRASEVSNTVVAPKKLGTITIPPSRRSGLLSVQYGTQSIIWLLIIALLLAFCRTIMLFVVHQPHAALLSFVLPAALIYLAIVVSRDKTVFSVEVLIGLLVCTILIDSVSIALEVIGFNRVMSTAYPAGCKSITNAEIITPPLLLKSVHCSLYSRVHYATLTLTSFTLFVNLLALFAGGFLLKFIKRWKSAVSMNTNVQMSSPDSIDNSVAREKKQQPAVSNTTDDVVSSQTPLAESYERRSPTPVALYNLDSFKESKPDFLHGSRKSSFGGKADAYATQL